MRSPASARRCVTDAASPSSASFRRSRRLRTQGANHCLMVAARSQPWRGYPCSDVGERRDGGGAGREAVGGAGPGARAGRAAAGKGVSAWERVHRHLGCRASRWAGAAARDPAGVAAVAARLAADPAARMAAGGPRADQGPVRGGPQNPHFAQGGPRRVRHRRRARGRADLPLHLRGGRLPETVPAALDFVAHAGGDPAGVRRAEKRAGLRRAGRRGAGAQPGRLAGGDESLARLHAGRERAAFGRACADADAGDAGRARAGHPHLRPRRLHGSGGHVLA